MRRIGVHQRDACIGGQLSFEILQLDGQDVDHIKMRIRRIQRDLARRRMMQDVAKATAVIVNPTHYAVALRYQHDSAGTPLVVAKGKNYLALRIRQRAIAWAVSSPPYESPQMPIRFGSTSDRPRRYSPAASTSWYSELPALPTFGAFWKLRP